LFGLAYVRVSEITINYQCQVIANRTSGSAIVASDLATRISLVRELVG
jgi:hypothetical protein